MGNTPYILHRAFRFINVIIMSDPINEFKGRLTQFDKSNLALRKAIAQRQKELDAIMTARRTQAITAAASSKGISEPA